MGLGRLLLTGLAAYGVYKYSKMSSQEKSELIAKGKKLVNENIGNLSGRASNTANNVLDGRNYQ